MIRIFFSNKAGVHLRKSGAKKAGATSEGLAVEQLGALRGEGGEQNSDGLRARKERGRRDFEDETKPAPFKPKGAAPSKIKTSRTHSQPLIFPPPALWAVGEVTAMVRQNRSQRPHVQEEAVKKPSELHSCKTKNVP